MQLEKQVCSLELAKRLKELGVKQGSLFWWVTTKPTDVAPTTIEWKGDIELINEKVSLTYITEKTSAFTVAELSEELPDGYATFLTKVRGKLEWMCQDGAEELEQFADTEADARAKMLIYLIENELVTLTK